MHLDLDDVIAAVATPSGPAVRSVIRLSGESVIETLKSRFRSQNIESRWAQSVRAGRYPGHYQIDGWRTPVPVDLWLWPNHRSYTGQPSAEMHLIGSSPIVDAVLEQLYREGARPARAGEFTLRAFLAGRVDLVQAEAVLGVIDAADHHQLNTALTQLAGGLSRRMFEVRERLLLDLADLEAGLDFVEEDIEFVQRGQLLSRIDAALELAHRLLRQGEMRMLSGSRPRVVLAGLPNAGKSTLFNRLVGEDRAIVSDQAGTTRDYLRAELDWNGQAIELVDTAGSDAVSLGIAAEAEKLRLQQVAQADLVLWCSSATMGFQEAEVDHTLFTQVQDQGGDVLHVWTKCDQQAGPAVSHPCSLNVSARSGQGLQALRDQVVQVFETKPAHQGEWLATTASRARDSLERCVDGLQRTKGAIEGELGDELTSIELRSALDALGEVCGAVHTDDILDRIFSRFCIGK